MKVNLLQTRKEIYSTQYYIESFPHRRNICFVSKENVGFRRYDVLDSVLINLPLPYVYYIINVQSNRSELYCSYIAISPERLERWSADTPGYALPLPDMTGRGTLCSPSQTIQNRQVRAALKIGEPTNEHLKYLIDVFFSSRFNIFEEPGQSHRALMKWGGAGPVATYQTPYLKPYREWGKLRIKDLPEQKWLWAQPINYNSFYKNQHYLEA